MQTGASPTAAALAHTTATGADAAAAAACAVWLSVSAALSPIVGPHGVAALYKRSLYLTRGQHPSLNSVHDAAGGIEDFTALQQTLSSQSGEIAAAANSALHKTFYDLLSSLIGPALTERLLRPVLDRPPTDQTTQAPTL